MPVVVAHLDDASGSHSDTLQARREGHRLGLGKLREQNPAANAVRLTLACAAEGGDLCGDDAVARDAGRIFDILHLLAAHVAQVVPGYKGDCVPRLRRRARIAELPLDDVGVREQVSGVAWRILRGDDRRSTPVKQAAERTCHIVEQLVGILASLDVSVHREARLHAALPVRHHLVAILADRIERPLVHSVVRDVLAKAVALIGDQVIEAPCGIVGPCNLERAIPRTCVGSSLGTVVDRHLHSKQAHVVCPLRDAVELLCVNADSYDGGVRVAQLGVDNLRH